MKKYRLLRDLPFAKADDIVKEHYIAGTAPFLIKESKDGQETTVVNAPYYQAMKDAGIFDEWFEEIKVNKCWRPEQEEEYTYVLDDGTLAMTIYIRGNEHDEARIEMGNCFKGKREAFIISEKLRALRRLREKGLRFDHALRYGERLIDGRENAGFISISFSNDVDGQKDNPMKFDENIQRDLDLLFKEEK